MITVSVMQISVGLTIKEDQHILIKDVLWRRGEDLNLR